MNSPWRRTGLSGHDYDAKFASLERSGQDMHGEANLISALDVSSVLDAGCGTGRVAIELARRGLSVAGVDRDRDMLRAARDKAPQIDWYLDDLARVVIPDPIDPTQSRQFEAIVMAGNVMLFVDAGTEEAVVANLARHLAPGGLLVSGFQLQLGGLNLDRYDTFATRAGLELATRWSTWDRDPWSGQGDYAVSVHRRPT
jgi:SAM-dependent methyltransferase